MIIFVIIIILILFEVIAQSSTLNWKDYLCDRLFTLNQFMISTVAKWLHLRPHEREENVLGFQGQI